MLLQLLHLQIFCQGIFFLKRENSILDITFSNAKWENLDQPNLIR